MKKEDPYRVQAELQKQRLKRVEVKEKTVGMEEEQAESSLPSRSTVHKNKKKKFKIPIISLLAFLFVLLPVGVLVINSLLNGNDLSNILSTEQTSGLFENVNIQKENSQEKETNLPKPEEQEEMVIESNPTRKQEEAATPDNEMEQTKDETLVTNKENASEEEQTVKEERKAEKAKEEQEEKNKEKQNEQQQEKKAVETNPHTESNQKIIYHTVAKGENLYRIALKYYPSGDGMEKIKAANNMATDQVQLGQTLKIVLDQ